MKKNVILAVSVTVLMATISTAQSQILLAYTGATDPTNEGFSLDAYLGTATVSPLANDLGLPAWEITCPDNFSTQFSYTSGLSTNQEAEIGSQGFTLTLVARVMQNYAPAFNANTPYVIEGASVSPTQTNRYDIDLATDSSGNTIVVLPSIIVGADGSTCAAPDSNLTVTVSGNAYHTYQLVQSPATGLADLYVDGVELLQGYSGTYVPGGGRGYGLNWGVCNGGGANFNLVQVSAGPALSPVPVITWTNPAPILYGTALSTNQLNATANVPGSFAYNPTNGTVLNVGTNTLSVTFTPTETGDSSVTDSVSLVVLAPQPIINIQKAVYLTSTNLLVGLNYQVQASSDLINWTNQGSEFTASNSNWQSTNYWNVNDWNQLFFQLQVLP